MAVEAYLLDFMPPIINPHLMTALFELPYPLASYREFSISWPYSHTEIETMHKWMNFQKAALAA